MQEAERSLSRGAAARSGRGVEGVEGVRGGEGGVALSPSCLVFHHICSALPGISLQHIRAERGNIANSEGERGKAKVS